MIRCRLCHSHANRRHLRYYHTNSQRLRHNCAIGRSLCSYAHDFRHWNIPTEINLFLIGTTKNVLSTCPEAGFTSNTNDFTPKSNDFTPDSKNPFRQPSLGLIDSFSCCAINPESHLPQEGKAKRFVKRIKGRLTS